MYPFLNPLLRSRILGSGLLLLGCMAVWECPFSNPAVLASSAVLLASARGMAFDDDA
jgi:hypothetical protein